MRSTACTSTTTTTTTSPTSCAKRGFGLPESNVRDGYTKDITFIAGINTPDGRGNATVYIGYRTLDPITQDRRDFSACALASSDAGDPTSTEFACGGSGTTASGLFQTYNPADPFDFEATGAFTVGEDGAMRDFGAGDLYNFAPTNYYQRADERKTAGLFAHYDFSDNASVYTEFMFMDDRTQAQIAPSGAFLGSGPGQPPFFGRYAVNCDNPLLTPTALDAFCGGDAGRATCCSTSAAATSKAAGATTTCGIPRSAASSACAATSRTAGATTSTACTARRSCPRTSRTTSRARACARP